MCGRYIFATDEEAWMHKLLQNLKKRMKPEEFEKISLFEVFPSDLAVILFQNPDNGSLRIQTMKWGFKGKNGNLIINARSETAFSDSSFFRGCLPCAVPASSYFEWSKTKKKFSFRLDEPFFLGGLYRMEQGELHFVILTEEADFPQNEIHTRQPVLFTAEDAKTWAASKQPTLLLSHSVSERIIEEA